MGSSGVPDGLYRLWPESVWEVAGRIRNGRHLHFHMSGRRRSITFVSPDPRLRRPTSRGSCFHVMARRSLRPGATCALPEAAAVP